MKQNYLKKLMTALLLLCCTVASAADFKVDGIYYNILSSSDKTVEVTRGSNKYSGAVTIPASVTYNSITYSITSIGRSAFSGYRSLTSIEIPEGVTSIGNYAFEGCSGLTSIVVDEGNSVYDSRNNCNAIIETASNTLIAGCKNTIIPAGVTSIGKSAFSGCSGLTSIIIPEGVTSIGGGAFSGCIGLTSIVIPEGVTSIGVWPFYGCTGLTSIVVDEGNTVYDSRNNCNAIIKTASNTLIVGCKNTIIPAGVTSIGPNAFSLCSGLTSIEIPAGVTSISDWAFEGCSDLTSITSHIAAENLFFLGHNAFDGVDKTNCTLYVPAGAKATYAATDGWKDFANIVEMSSDGSDATAIEGIETEPQGEAVYYDLSGRRVENPTRGIYIVNGAKVLVK